MTLQIPESEMPLVIRTDFSNDAAWESIRQAVQESDESSFGMSFVDFVDDEAWDGITKQKLLHLVTEDYSHSLVILADKTAMSKPDFPLLVVDLAEERGREFRAVPSAVGLVAANLSTANMDFGEFSAAVDKDAVFRGFSE